VIDFPTNLLVSISFGKILLAILLALAAVAGIFGFLVISFVIGSIYYVIVNSLVVWIVGGKIAYFSICNLSVDFRKGAKLIRWDKDGFADTQVLSNIHTLPTWRFAIGFTFGAFTCFALGSYFAVQLILDMANSNGFYWTVERAIAAMLAFGLLRISLPYVRYADLNLLFEGLANSDYAKDFALECRQHYESFVYRPRDMNVKDYNVEKDVPKNCLLFLYWHHMDANEVLEAEPYIRRSFNLIDDETDNGTSEFVLYEAAIYYTRFIDDHSVARIAIADAQRRFPESPRNLTLKGALAWRSGNMVDAKKYWDESRQKCLEAAFDNASKDHINDWFDRLLDNEIPLRTL